MYYILIDKFQIRDGIQYQIGSNTNYDALFTTIDFLPLFLHYGELLVEIEIPIDAKISIHSNKQWKTNKFIATKIYPISQWELWNNPVFCLNAVKQNGLLLRFITNQTEEICLAAINKHEFALEFCLEQTEKICLAAVNKNGCALQFVRMQNPKICLIAVRQNLYALKYCLDQTEEICLVAIKQDGWMI